MANPLRCRLTNSANFVTYVMGAIWDETCEDGASFDEFAIDPKSTWVEFVDGEKRIGVFTLKRFNDNTLEFHIQILPQFRRDYSHYCADALHEWLSNTQNIASNFKTLIAYIPKYYENVQKFAQASGWDIVGNIPNAYTKQSRIYDITIYTKSLDELRSIWVQP